MRLSVNGMEKERKDTDDKFEELLKLAHEIEALTSPSKSSKKID